MKKKLESVKKLTKDEQKKISGGDDPCYTLQGSYGLCKTNALCQLDLPLCEAI